MDSEMAHQDGDDTQAPDADGVAPESSARTGEGASPVETVGSRGLFNSSPLRFGLVVGTAFIVALAALCGWLGYQANQARQDVHLRALLVQVAKQGAVNLTTIDYEHAESDVERILDSATGAFRADFQNRSAPFIDVVKQAKSKSEGTVTEAGLEALTGEQGQVLVSVTVTTTSDGKPDEQPRYWRMRMTVTRQDGDAKVSNVEFVA